MAITPWPTTLLPAASVLQHLRTAYPLRSATRCEYLTSGLHHHYLVTDGERRYVCRAYRRAWRSHAAALAELELLDQLQQHSAPVAFPIRTNDQQLAIEIDTPQSRTTLALCHYAPGNAPGSEITLEQARQLGQATAQLHISMSHVVTQQQRQNLDFSYLFAQSLQILATLLTPAVHSDLERRCETLQQQIPKLPQHSPYFGLIHGDINLKNIHFTAQSLLFIDFDQCGPGWYAFEIGKFCHAISHLAARQQLQQSFLQAYQAVRPLSAQELDAIGFFVPLAHLWIMAIHAYNAEYLGPQLTAEFWQKKIHRWNNLLDVALSNH
jgi:Ser/Thr protein kinase RdoA (MazF antagonist)